VLVVKGGRLGVEKRKAVNTVVSGKIARHLDKAAQKVAI
jgi:hypothetical protein